MIMEGVSGVCDRASPHSSPTKRSFDVAFLTGARDRPSGASLTSSEVTVTSPAKIIRQGIREERRSASPPPGSDVRDSPRDSRDDPAPGSAFTKVTRGQGSSASSSPHFSTALDALSTAWPPVSASFSTLFGSTKLAPLLAAPGLLPPTLASFLPPENLNNNLVEEYLKAHHPNPLESKMAAAAAASSSSPSGTDLSASEALSRLRTSIYPASSSDPYKLPFPSLPPLHLQGTTSGGGTEAKLRGAAPPSYLGAAQPSIASLMPPTFSSMALSAQNVCAKCNISFRMTSDLVYHMRSQHKREPDPYKKRRNEKLKCSFCGESFRERHHLTRHMSAHQDRKEEQEAK